MVTSVFWENIFFHPKEAEKNNSIDAIVKYMNIYGHNEYPLMYKDYNCFWKVYIITSYKRYLGIFVSDSKWFSLLAVSVTDIDKDIIYRHGWWAKGRQILWHFLLLSASGSWWEKNEKTNKTFLFTKDKDKYLLSQPKSSKNPS